METVTQHKTFQLIEAQVRELYGRVVWTHKTHEKCADLLNKKNQKIKIVEIILSALTSTGFIATIFSKDGLVSVLGAILSFMLLAINLYSKDYDLGEIAHKHSETATSLWDIREKYLSLLTDIRARTVDITEIHERRELLQEKLQIIYKSAPRTNAKAYKEASKALKEMEEMTFTEEEIDKFLPKKLKIRKNK